MHVEFTSCHKGDVLAFFLFFYYFFLLYYFVVIFMFFLIQLQCLFVRNILHIFIIQNTIKESQNENWLKLLI